MNTRRRLKTLLSSENQGKIFLGFAILGLLVWCWFLWGVDMQPSFMDCPAGHQRISGWSNGSYTNICISPTR